MTTPITGRGGAVDGIPAIRTWQISPTETLQRAYHSGSRGAPEILDGNKDFTGSFAAYGFQPLKMPGDTFTLTASLNGAQGATGPVIVDSINLTINKESKQPIGYIVNFSANGELTLGSAAASDLDVTNRVFSPKDCVLNTGLAPDAELAALEHWRSCTIRISRDNQAFNTSEWAQRLEGNLSASVEWSLYKSTWSDLPDLGSEHQIKLELEDNGDFWLFNWVRVERQSDLVCDRESRRILSATIGTQWAGWYSATPGAEMEIGTITLPDGTEWWPDVVS